MRISRERFAPDFIDYDVVKFMNSKRTDHTMDTHLMEFDVLREKAQSRMVIVGDCPDEIASVHCMHNAAVPKNDASLVLARLLTALPSTVVSSQMRLLVGPCGSAARQGILVAAS